MYRKILSLLAFAALAAGCLNQPADPQAPGVSGYSFTVEVDNPVFIYTEPTKSVISTQDGSISLPLTYKVTEGIEAGSHTRATQYDTLEDLGKFKVTAYDGDEKLINDKEVKKSKNGWKLADDPKTWKEGHSMNFFAYANLPEGSSIGNVTSSSQTFNCTVQNTAAKQGDALLGYYSGDGDRKGEAALKFNHPLTAVVFKIGNIVEGDHTGTVTGIDSVSLIGVYESGTAVANGSGDCLSYNWTPGSGTITVSEPLSGPVGTVGDAFLLIPQNLSEHPVTVEAVLTTNSGTKKAQVALDRGEWKAGKTNTYVLGYTDYISVTGISLNKTSTTIKKTDSETLVATISPEDADNKTVTWTTSNDAVATVNDAGKVTAVGVGECVITATPADGAIPATCTVTVTNPVTGVSLDKTSLVLAQTGEKSTATLVATMTYYDGTTKVSSSIADCVTWTSSNENVATVDENGVVTAQEDLGSAMATITATTKDKKEDGNSMSARCTLTVPYISIAPSLYVAPGSTSLKTQTLARTFNGATPVSVSYHTSDAKYATISNDGVVEAQATGSCVVWVEADFGNGFTSRSNDCNVEVSPGNAEPTIEMVVSPSEIVISPLEEAMATATVSYHYSSTVHYDNNVNWTSSNEGVAKVNAQGIVVGVNAGECNLTATPVKDESVSSVIHVIVANVAHVTLNRTALGLIVGGTYDLTARVTHSDGSKDSNVDWSSSNSSIVSVNSSGHIEAKAVGSASITATSKTEPSLKATCEVSVTASEVKVTGVTLNRETVVVAPGSTAEVIASIAPSDATNQNVTWSSSSPYVVSVSGSGNSCTLTGVGVGKATVTVTTEDGGFKATCTVLVPGVVIPSGNYYTGKYYNPINGVYNLYDSKTPIYFSLFPSELNGLIRSVNWSDNGATWEGVASTKSTIVSSFNKGSLSVSVILETGQMLVSNTVSVTRQGGSWTQIKEPVLVNPTSLSMKAGSLESISVAVPEYTSVTRGDTNVQWSSTDDEIAVVVNDGGNLKIRALKEGSCDIVAKAAWDLTKTASIHVTVTE